MIKPRWESNRWRIQARKDGKRYSFSSSTPGVKGRKEVQQKYEAWYFGEASGEKTVKQVCDEYIEDLKARRGEQAPCVEQNEKYIRLYIAPKCSQKKICKMTLRDWQTLINGATGRNKALSEKTLKNLRGVIMAIIKFGYEDYQCEMPRGKLYIPIGHSKKEKEILQPKDVKRLLEAKSSLWYYNAICFALCTGIRPGELLGLKKQDMGEGEIFIKRAINEANQITEGKNANAKRMIPIGIHALTILEDTIRRNDEYSLHTDWIFCSPDGSHGTQQTLRKHWIRLRNELELPQGASVYSLRHTFVSLMKGVLPEQVIKDIVGHSVSMQTFEVYGHIVDTEKRAAADIIDLTMFGGNSGDNKSTRGVQN